MYYNTTNESESDIIEFREKAESQDQKVLGFCREMREFTASNIFEQFLDNTPLTSIRRALNTLEKKDLIAKTKTKVLGMYNRPETLYISLEA